MEVHFPTDSDGYLSQECPSCEQRFKVVIGEDSEEPVFCCPYCGYKGQDCWFTVAQIEYMQAIATDVVVAPELKKLEREFEKSSGGILKLDMKSNLSGPTPAPMEIDEPFTILHFPCCNESVKVNRQERHFCVICGSEIDMKTSDSKKVFLSHKGVDKEMVKDFKQTLESLGYDPWLDEDAMPAGTSLERGILQGMKDSCGAVFFITPSFKDEGYLETEIDYAIQQKREKGDRFAIAILRFVEDGQQGEIPELLKTYVWKSPTTPLEALREIVRALPVSSSVVDWRDEIAGVVTTPTTKSTSAELSDEAKAILQSAAAGDGHILHSRHSGGEDIHSSGREMITDQDPRIVARWVGGLEDLQRRAFIKDLGHKGEVFKVTREGYEASDEVSHD